MIYRSQGDQFTPVCMRLPSLQQRMSHVQGTSLVLGKMGWLVTIRGTLTMGHSVSCRIEIEPCRLETSTWFPTPAESSTQSSKAFPLKVWSADQQHWRHVGVYLKGRILGCTPDLLNQDIQLNMILEWFIPTLNFERHGSKVLSITISLWSWIS